MRAPRIACGLLLAACAPREAPVVAPPGSLEPSGGTQAPSPVVSASAVPAAPTAPSAPSAPSASNHALSSRDHDSVTVTPALPEPHVLLEAPYSALGHPKLSTEMLTLARDEELFQWALGGSADPMHPSNRPGYHPATRVVIDVELLSRAPKGSTRKLQALARSNGYWRVRACFEAAQRLAVKPERAARVRLTVSANGRVLGARSMPTRAERPYTQCVLERLRALDFSPGFTRKLDIELRAKQWPGDAPVPPRAPDAEPPLPNTAELRAALEGSSPALTDCYRSALSADLKLWGRLALRLRLADGVVTDATQVETRFPSESFVACARQAVLGARLPTTVSELTFAMRLGQPPAPPAGAPPSVPGAPASAPPEPPPPAPAPAAPPAPVH